MGRILSVLRGGTAPTASTFSYGLALAFARGLPVIAMLVASLRLPASEFGIVALLVAAITTVSQVADAGMDSGTSWLASRTEGRVRVDQIFGGLTSVRTFVSLIAAVALVTPQVLLASDRAMVQWSLAVISILGCVCAGMNSAQRLRMRVEGAGERPAILLEKSVLSVFFLSWLVLAPSTAVSICFGYSTAALVGPVVARVLLRSQTWRTSAASLRSILITCAPFILMAVFIALTWRATTFWLGHVTDAAAAGYFVLAYYPIQFIVSVPVAAAPLLLIANRYNSTQEKAVMKRAILMGSVTALAIIGMCVAAIPIVPDSVVSHDVIKTLGVLGLCLPFLWCNPVLMSLIRARGGLWLPTISSAAGAAVALVFLYVLAPGLGAVGAAISVVAGEACHLTLQVIFLRVQTKRLEQLASPVSGDTVALVTGSPPRM